MASTERFYRGPRAPSLLQLGRGREVLLSIGLGFYHVQHFQILPYSASDIFKLAPSRWHSSFRLIEMITPRIKAYHNDVQWHVHHLRKVASSYVLGKLECSILALLCARESISWRRASRFSFAVLCSFGGTALLSALYGGHSLAYLLLYILLCYLLALLGFFTAASSCPSPLACCLREEAFFGLSLIATFERGAAVVLGVIYLFLGLLYVHLPFFIRLRLRLAGRADSRMSRSTYLPPSAPYPPYSLGGIHYYWWPPQLPFPFLFPFSSSTAATFISSSLQAVAPPFGVLLLRAAFFGSGCFWGFCFLRSLLYLWGLHFSIPLFWEQAV